MMKKKGKMIDASRLDKSELKLLQYRIDLLKSAGSFDTLLSPCTITYRQDAVRAQEIRDFFGLQSLYTSEMSTWDKVLEIGRLVARNIPDGYPVEPPKEVNAIGLWQYTREVAPELDSRLHGILTSELLLSLDIISRYVVCMPYDAEVQQVLNEVWLPELGKWAMIDTDYGGYYVSDTEGVPLSLWEIREKYITDGAMLSHPELGEGTHEKDWYYSYLAANSYWYIFEPSYTYNIEQDGKDHVRLALVPEGYTPFGHHHITLTHDVQGIWGRPVLEQERK